MRITTLALALLMLAAPAWAEDDDEFSEEKMKAAAEAWEKLPHEVMPEKPREVPRGYIWSKGRLIKGEDALPYLESSARWLRKEVGPLIATIQPWRGGISVERVVDDADPGGMPLADGTRLLAIELGTHRWADKPDKSDGQRWRQGPMAASPMHIRVKCGPGVYPLSVIEAKGLMPAYPTMDLDPGDDIIGWVTVELPTRVSMRSCNVRFEDMDGKSEWINLGEAVDFLAKHAEEEKAKKAAEKKAKGKRKKKRRKRRKKRR